MSRPELSIQPPCDVVGLMVIEERWTLGVRAGTGGGLPAGVPCPDVDPIVDPDDDVDQVIAIITIMDHRPHDHTGGKHEI